MKHNKIIAAVAMGASVFTMSSAHAFAPAVAAAWAAVIGAGIGSTAGQNHQPEVAAVPAPAVAVVPESTTVLGGPGTTIQEVVPAPRDGFRWQGGHFEVQNGTSAWVPGHWIADDAMIHN